MKPIAAILFGIFLVAGWPSAGFADGNRVDPRESAADRALGGMEEGSRMPSPEGSFTESGRRVPGSMLSPAMDTRAMAPGGAGAGPQAPASQGSVSPGAGGGLFESAAPGSGELGGGAEPPGPSDGSIMDIDADVNVGGGGVDANLDVGLDTEAGGGLLELDAASDVAAEAPVSMEVDSAESAVIESDLGIEEGINEAPASGEVEAGIEADVDASGESDEPIDNPADGLSL